MELRNLILSRIQPLTFYVKELGLVELPEGHIACPIHKDTNPSLHIRKDGTAHCYSCNKTWKNVISFYMDLHKITLSHALYRLYSKR